MKEVLDAKFVVILLWIVSRPTRPPESILLRCLNAVYVLNGRIANMTPPKTVTMKNIDHVFSIIGRLNIHKRSWMDKGLHLRQERQYMDLLRVDTKYTRENRDEFYEEYHGQDEWLFEEDMEEEEDEEEQEEEGRGEEDQQ